VGQGHLQQAVRELGALGRGHLPPLLHQGQQSQLHHQAYVHSPTSIFHHCQLTSPITENLDKTKVTGIGPVDNLQDGVNGLATGQLGQGGLLQPVTDKTSKEGINRAERQGKDDKGGYVPSSIPGGEAASNAVGGAAEGGKSVASSVGSGIKGAGGYIGSAFGGGKKSEGEQQK
jgi:hypothetical protein